MGGPYLMGIDIGTYSSKGVLVGLDGRVKAAHVAPHEVDMPHGGYFEQDADGVWWGDLVQITRRLLEKSGADPGRILGIGLSAIGPCVLPVDEDGHPLRPGILYGIDTRAVGLIPHLEKEIGRETIFKRCGVNLDAQAAGPKILWIRENEPDVFRRTKWFLTAQSYLVQKLTGRAVMDVYSACCYAPLYDIHQRSWSPDLAGLITPVDRLPHILWSSDVAGRVTDQAARETGLAPGTPVVAGTIDAAAEAVSAGMSEYGDMMLMFGSSIFFIVMNPVRVSTPRFWSADFLEPGTYAFMGGMSTSGSLTTWFRNQFALKELEREASGGENAYALLQREAAESTPGANGLIALPYFAGERTPIQDPDAKGLIFGLNLKHTRGDVYRALLEGVAYGIRHNIEAMSEEGVAAGRILAVGGGTKNDLWMRLVADIAGIDLVIPEQQIGAAYGDAFLAGIGVGRFHNLKDITAWVGQGKMVTPNPDRSDRYESSYRIYRSLYESTRSLMHELKTAG